MQLLDARYNEWLSIIHRRHRTFRAETASNTRGRLFARGQHDAAVTTLLKLPLVISVSECLNACTFLCCKFVTQMRLSFVQ